MKLTDLQKVLGEQIKNVTSEEITESELQENIKRAMAVASLAKQMINNADVVMRFDKLKTLKPETQTKIEDMI